MKNNSKVEQINALLDKEFELLANNGSKTQYTRIKISDLRILLEDIDKLIHALYNEDYKQAGIRCRRQYIPLLNYAIEKELNLEQKAINLNRLEEATRLSARTNFEDFVRYYEWNENDKFFEPRYSVLKAYAYYLNRMVFDTNFELLIVNLPSRNW